MPKKDRKSAENPRKPAPSDDDVLEMLKQIKIDKKSAYSVAKQYDLGKTSVYRFVEEYDKAMGKDDVSEEKLQEFIQIRKKSGRQTVS